MWSCRTFCTPLVHITAVVIQRVVCWQVFHVTSTIKRWRKTCGGCPASKPFTLWTSGLWRWTKSSSVSTLLSVSGDVTSWDLVIICEEVVENSTISMPKCRYWCQEILGTKILSLPILVSHFLCPETEVDDNYTVGGDWCGYQAIKINDFVSETSLLVAIFPGKPIVSLIFPTRGLMQGFKFRMSFLAPSGLGFTFTVSTVTPKVEEMEMSLLFCVCSPTLHSPSLQLLVKYRRWHLTKIVLRQNLLLWVTSCAWPDLE